MMYSAAHIYIIVINLFLFHMLAGFQAQYLAQIQRQQGDKGTPSQLQNLQQAKLAAHHQQQNLSNDWQVQQLPPDQQMVYQQQHFQTQQQLIAQTQLLMQQQTTFQKQVAAQMAQTYSNNNSSVPSGENTSDSQEKKARGSTDKLQLPMRISHGGATPSNPAYII